MKSFAGKLLFIVLGGLLSIALVVAQGTNCPEIVQRALESANESCSNVGRNQLCYGFDQVQASFINEVSDDYFSQVSDIIPVAELATVQTLPMNEATGQWGVAIMTLQANIPNTIPGTNVKFVLMGDVEVENAVAPEEIVALGDGIEISLNVDSANLRSGAGLNFNVIVGASRGETLITDGISENGEWLRVVKNGRPAWLNRALVVDNPQIASLPVLDDIINSPMQAFYLRTSFAGEECVDAPQNALLVQGPENIQVNLSINGVNVTLGSTGVFRIVDEGGQPSLELVVLDGQFTLDGTVVRQGQRSRVCLGDENSRGLDGENNDLVATCEPSPAEWVQNFGANWCGMENIPAGIINYEIEVLCPGESQPTPAPSSNTASQSETEAVDCSGFSILTTDVPATNFTLSWTEATGADTYEIAVFDTSGYQLSSARSSSTEIVLNGGQGFPSVGYVDLRAYRGGEYACFTRLNFTRSADPNEVIAPPSTADVRISCTYIPGPEDWHIVVEWFDVVAPVTVTYFGSSSFPPTASQNFASSTGSYVDDIPDPLGTSMRVEVSTGDGQDFTKIC